MRKKFLPPSSNMEKICGLIQVIDSRFWRDACYAYHPVQTFYEDFMSTVILEI